VIAVEGPRRLAADQRPSLDADPRNQPSITLLERLGFRREGLLREHYFAAGEPQDALFFGLLAREWRAAER
jgi:RimJ/RimL family protein N-acetyltransferase